MEPVVALSRILHILGAIFLFGGVLFMRYILSPAASTLPDDQHEKLRSEVTNRWKFVVHAGIAVLIFTGFYNYLWVMKPLHEGDGPYHMWMGIKILLAFVVFFIGSALVGRTKALEAIRNKRMLWLSVLVTLSTIIVVIAGVLKVRGVVETEEVEVIVTEEPTAFFEWRPSVFSDAPTDSPTDA